MWPSGRWPPGLLNSSSFALHLSSGEVTAVGRLGRAEHPSRCLGAPRLWAFPHVPSPASPTHHPREGAQRPQEQPAPSLCTPSLGPVLPWTLLFCSLPDTPGRCKLMLEPPLFSPLKQRNEVRPLLFRVSGKACPGLGEAPSLVAESGHLPEDQVSFHFEMSLQVPRKEKENSCCCHHQLFPRIVQPVQLPLRTLLMKAGRCGPTWPAGGGG